MQGVLLSTLLWLDPQDWLWQVLIRPISVQRDRMLWMARPRSHASPGARGQESAPTKPCDGEPRSSASVRKIGGYYWKNGNWLFNRTKQMLSIKSSHYYPSSFLKQENWDPKRLSHFTFPKITHSVGEKLPALLNHCSLNSSMKLGSPAAVSWKITVSVCNLGRVGSRKDVCN